MAENHTIRYTLDATDNASPTIGKVGDEIKRADDAADQAGSPSGGMSKLQTTALAIGGALAAWGIADKIVELNNIGDAANKAEKTFTQLIGGTEQADDAMAKLRESTSGAVDDLTLMEGANRLLVTGLAKNSAEAARLVEIGTKLSGAMGVDAKEGVENFAAAINNMSYERLDTLGISASKVRERVNELKEAGYDTQEAFKLAVLEQGAVTLERLGTAAETSATGIQKLNTRIQNLVQDVGQGVNRTIDAAATSIDQILQIGDMRQQLRDQAQERAQTFVNEYQIAIEQYMAQSDEIDLSYVFGGRDGFANALADAFKQVEADPSLKNDMQGMAIKMLGLGDWARDSEAVTMLADSLSMAFSDAAAQVEIDAQNTALAEQAERLAAINTELAREKTHREDMWQAAREYNQQITAASNSFEYFTDVYGDLMGMPKLSEFMTQADADQFSAALDQAKDDLEVLKELNEQDLISDDQLQQAEDMTTRLEGMVDQAQAAAEAFANLSLTDVFGQTSGGMQGEITDLIMQRMQEEGASEEQMAAMQRALDLASGRETTGSLALEERIIPLIAQMSEERAAQAVANIEQFLQQAALQGYSQNMMANLLPSMADKGWDYYNYDPLSSVSAPGGDMAGGGIGEPTEAMQELANLSGDLRDGMSEVNAEAETFKGTLAEITGMEHVVKVKLDISGLDALQAALNGGSPVVPGDPRVGGRPGSGNGNTTSPSSKSKSNLKNK